MSETEDASLPRPAAAPAAGGARLPHRGLLLFVVLVALLVDFTTDTPYVPGRWFGPFYQLWPASQTTSAVSAAGLCLLALLPLLAFRRRRAAPTAVADGGVLLRLLPIPAMVLAFFWTRPHVLGRLVLPFTLLLGVAVATVAYGAVRRWSPARIATAAILVGVVVRAIHFVRYPIGVGGDMLPLTRAALDSLWAGQSPYGYHKVPELLPLTYYPLTWLAYLPAYLLRVDLRWTNVAAELAIPAAALYAIAGGQAGDGPQPAAAAKAAVWLSWCFVFLLPSSVYFDRITTAPVAWAVLAWTLAVVVRASRWDWLWAGLLAATTPLAAVPGVLLLVAWWRQLAWRRVLVRVALAGAVAAAIVLPFYLWSPRGFVDGAILWFNDLDRFPGTKWRAFQTWQRYVGFGGLFWRAGWQRWLAVVQWLLVAGVAVVYAVRGGRRRELPAVAASAFVAFMVFNSVHWPYFYQPAVWSGLLALTAREA